MDVPAELVREGRGAVLRSRHHEIQPELRPDARTGERCTGPGALEYWHADELPQQWRDRPRRFELSLQLGCAGAGRRALLIRPDRKGNARLVPGIFLFTRRRDAAGLISTRRDRAP